MFPPCPLLGHAPLARGRARKEEPMATKVGVRQVAERRYWRGGALARFAGPRGVGPRRLARWVSRLSGAGEGSLRFHPVRLVESPPETGGGAPIEIQLAGGRRVRVPRGFETEDLRRVLVVLEEAATC